MNANHANSRDFPLHSNNRIKVAPRLERGKKTMPFCTSGTCQEFPTYFKTKEHIESPYTIYNPYVKTDFREDSIRETRKLRGH